MRVPGSVIWATDLVEHRQSSGGGKGRPSVTTYSYSASFAVALASRPIGGIGRIWADGNLLRGAGGDMRASGQLRTYLGHGDQLPDVLMAGSEMAGQCPAYRGTAYVVFDNLDLSDFGNRIPTVTFEVFADAGPLDLGMVAGEVLDDTACAVPLPRIAGLSCEGPMADLVEQLSAIMPIDCDVSGSGLSLATPSGAPRALRTPTLTAPDDGFGAKSGFQRKRLPPSERLPQTLRYYDVDRDYQPGLQRSLGRPGTGQPAGIELPMAMTAANARATIETAARRAGWSRQIISWRTAEFDPAVRPGSLVTVPEHQGIWKVADWEWRSSGIELSLARCAPVDATGAMTEVDPGRAQVPSDVPISPTTLVAFELPWDGSGSGDVPAIFAAASAPSSSWAGASLFLDSGDGQLQPLGTSGRTRSIVGSTLAALAPASPHIFDRTTTVDVALVDPTMELQDATTRALAQGANRALIGNEIVQFAQAQPIGSGTWRLSGLLRGRGGTEGAISAHAGAEPFVLLDNSAVALDGAIIGQIPSATIEAIGVADPEPVTAAIFCRGLTRRPLFPVRPHRSNEAGGGVVLSWTRRARGAWTWLDGVETPLHEEAEAYDVILGSPEAPLMMWSTSGASLTLSAAQWSGILADHHGAPILVRQRGSYSVSESVQITTA